MIAQSSKRKAGKSAAAPAKASPATRLALLAVGDDSEDGPLRQEDLALLNSLAPRVHSKPLKAAKSVAARPPRLSAPQSIKSRRPLHVGTISSEKDLDAALKRNPLLLNDLPCERKQIIKASRKCPARMVLAPDEQWAMVDSGASVNGMDVKSQAPGFDRLLQHATKRKRYIAANGGEMLIDSEIELCCELDGHQMAVKFDALPVQCSILNVRRIITSVLH